MVYDWDEDLTVRDKVLMLDLGLCDRTKAQRLN